MKEVLEKQQEFFASGETKSFAFRVKMLKRLREAILAFEEEIFEALKRDLKKSKVDAYTAENGHCLAEITYVLKHLKKWMTSRQNRDESCGRKLNAGHT